jgi:histidinol-phosphate aminotransferase
MESSDEALRRQIKPSVSPSPFDGEGRVPLVNRPVHGGIKPAELRTLGLKPEDVLDFSASISPIGPPVGIWDAMRRVDLTAYPDPQCLELREAIARYLAVSGRRSAVSSVGLERILVGNGSTELIHLLARGYLSPPCPGTTNTAFLLIPTYGEYEGACRLVGAAISCMGAQHRAGFLWDLEETARRIAIERPSLVFLCNPNNPTGVYLQQPEVESLAEVVASAGGLLVLDEAYVSFVDRFWDSLALLKWENVVLLRSMTKDYALTGLRLGYSLASREVTARLASWQPDWSVNGLAQAAGVAALADAGYLPRARQAVAQSKEYLTAQLTALGFTVMSSTANFLMVQVGDGPALRDQLMRRGFFVRDCASFGLPDYIRIGIRALPDCQRLVEAMKAGI